MCCYMLCAAVHLDAHPIHLDMHTNTHSSPSPDTHARVMAQMRMGTITHVTQDTLPPHAQPAAYTYACRVTSGISTRCIKSRDRVSSVLLRTPRHFASWYRQGGWMQDDWMRDDWMRDDWMRDDWMRDDWMQGDWMQGDWMQGDWMQDAQGSTMMQHQKRECCMMRCNMKRLGCEWRTCQTAGTMARPPIHTLHAVPTHTQRQEHDVPFAKEVSFAKEPYAIRLFFEKRPESLARGVGEL